MFGDVHVAGYLRFDDDLVPDVKRGDRELTARHDFDRLLPVGEVIELVDESGDVFGLARVLSCFETDVETFVGITQEADGYPTFHTTLGYAGELAKYYADVDFRADTPLTAIRFEVILLVE